jgi:hypothetical protein
MEPAKFDRITINAQQMNGQPCIRNLRLTVKRVLNSTAQPPALPSQKPTIVESRGNRGFYGAGVVVNVARRKPLEKPGGNVTFTVAVDSASFPPKAGTAILWSAEFSEITRSVTGAVSGTFFASTTTGTAVALSKATSGTSKLPVGLALTLTPAMLTTRTEGMTEETNVLKGLDVTGGPAGYEKLCTRRQLRWGRMQVAARLIRSYPGTNGSLIPGMHAHYIGWEQYEDNQKRLRENAQAQGRDRAKTPPREGPALLQGLVMCGVCGGRMTVRYHSRAGRLLPDYVCQKDGIEHARPFCQSVNGEQIDDTIGKLLVQTITPLTLEVTLAVEQELQVRMDEVDRLRRKQVERARYEADLAQRRYMHVDPANPLVADSLEAEWNNKLRALNEAQQEYERLRQTDRIVMDEAQRRRITALASDFPRLWRDPKTPDREKKRMVRLLLEDVTLIKRDQILVQVRFKGGVVHSLTLPLPLGAPELRKTDPACSPGARCHIETYKLQALPVRAGNRCPERHRQAPKARNTAPPFPQIEFVVLSFVFLEKLQLFLVVLQTKCTNTDRCYGFLPTRSGDGPSDLAFSLHSIPRTDGRGYFLNAALRLAA